MIQTLKNAILIIAKMVARKSLRYLPLPMLMQLATVRGRFHVEHYNSKGELLSTQDFDNGVTNVGKDLILDVMFNDATAILQSAWDISLIDNAGFTALAAADTMASHTGWVELQAYDEATRVAWGPGASASQSVTNAAVATFNLNATDVVYGIFVTSEGTKGGTTGTLWSTAAFSATIPVTSGDQLKITYTVSA